MWPAEFAVFVVVVIFGGFALLARVLPRYYEAHKPVPELWNGETVVHCTPLAWRFVGDSQERTGWGFLTDLRVVWVPTLMFRMTRFTTFDTADFYRPKKRPIEMRLTHLANVQRLEDGRALSFEIEGKLAILFFWAMVVVIPAKPGSSTWRKRLGARTSTHRSPNECATSSTCLATTPATCWTGWGSAPSSCCAR
jgi:hypothetical protein